VAREVFPPTQISLPPLRVYTFIPVTGQIISRQVVVEQGSPESAEGAVPALPAPAAAKAKVKAAAVGAGSAAGLQPPQVPNPVGQVVAGGKSNIDSKEAADDDVDGEEEEEEGEVDLEAELKKLETLQRGKKKKKGSAGQNVEPKAKKPKAK
jgi:hypothetical protein